MSRRRSIGAACAALLTVGLVGWAGHAAATTGGTTAASVPVEYLPDIIEEVPHHLQIQNTQQKEWLRFSTTHINVGSGNLQIRGGGQIGPCVVDDIAYDECTLARQEIVDPAGNVVYSQPAGSAVYHPEHSHWHQEAVAEFAIRRSITGPPITSGIKVTFCLVDVEFTGETGRLKKAQPRTYFECNGDLQGIASGWADSYHQSTPLQELDVTGLPAGDYYLTHLADPKNYWLESNDDNNFTWVKFRLSRKGANPEVTVLETSPCEPAIICGFGGNP